MKNSDTTIATDFFESIWPLLLLEKNECQIKSSKTCDYFKPEKTFDYLWAHEFLAEKCFEDYKPAIELKCKETVEIPTDRKAEEQFEQLPYPGPRADILPLDQQLAILQQDVEIRNKLAYDFANRRFPWYIQRPSYQKAFEITPEIKQIFKNKFEFKILQSIQNFKCDLMIIDVAPAVPLQNMECWLKYSPYVAIVTVIHDKDLYRKLKNFNHIFQPILKEENFESTWQEELERSLEMGVKMAKELFLFDDESKALVFVFAQNRGICVCDEFKILRKS